MAKGDLFYASKYTTIRNQVKACLDNYGVSLASSAVDSTYKISETQWDNLRTDLRKAYRHQKGLYPTLTDVTAQNIIYWSDISSYESTGSTVEAGIDTAYDGATSGAYTNQLLAYNSTAYALASGWNTSKVAISAISFANATEAARYFNLGGKISITCGATTGSPDLGWTNVITSLNESVVYTAANYRAGTNVTKTVYDGVLVYAANYGTVSISKTNAYTIVASLTLTDAKVGHPTVDEATGTSASYAVKLWKSVDTIVGPVPTVTTSVT